MQWWGRYLEVMTKPVADAPGVSELDIYRRRAGTPLLSNGRTNKSAWVLPIRRGSSLILRDILLVPFEWHGGIWFLPSKQELDALYNSRRLMVSRASGRRASMDVD